MNKKIIFIYLLLGFAGIVFAQETVIKSAEPIKVEANNEIEKSDIARFEVLEAKVDLCKDSFDRVNSTYQWAMGIIFTVILAFLGITGYNYHKNYKNDLEKIKKELEEDYQNKINEFVQKNTKQINDKTSIIEANLKKEIIELKFHFFDYQFKKETSERQKLSLALKVLNILSESNWGYTDWLFNDYFKYIEDCCSRKVYFDHSEVDDVKEMLAKLPTRFENEKNKLISVIDYEK